MNEWENEIYLAQPLGTVATKFCYCCGSHRYTIDFVDNKSFKDGKLPICSECLKSVKSNQYHERALRLLDEMGITAVCKKCGNDLSLSCYAVETNPNKSNELRTTCISCRKLASKQAFSIP